MKKILLSIANIMLISVFSGCEIDIDHSNTIYSINGWDGRTPYEHTLNEGLSTNYEGEEINMFITDLSEAIQFRSIVGEEPVVVEPDCFVSPSYVYGPSGFDESFAFSVSLRPKHVGRTFIRVYNSKYDVKIPINILPEYHIFTEPQIDFDDTEDSVNTKLHKLFGNLTYYSNSHYYQIGDSRCRYNLYVNYSEDGVVDNYIVELYQGVESDELTGYINERYYKTTASVGGLPVYIKAHNNEYPSISDATVIVMLDITDHKIKYQNPLTYSNQ